MDIFKPQSLISENKIVQASDIDLTEAYVQIGLYQPNANKYKSGNANAYKSYVIALSELGGGSTGWGLLGNAGTDPLVNFIGTTDGENFIIQPGAGNVGIGTNTPAAKLDIIGDINATITGPDIHSIGGIDGNNSGFINIGSGGFGLTTDNTISDYCSLAILPSGVAQLETTQGFNIIGTLSIVDGTEQAGYVWTTDGTGLGSWQPAGGGSSYWSANGDDIFNNNVGNVGVGLNTPLAKLQVAGTFIVSEDDTLESSAIITSNGTGGISKLGYNDAGLAFMGFEVDFNGGAGENRIHSLAADDTTILLKALNTVGDKLVLLNNGNLGLGTSTPGYILEVVGDLHNVNVAGDLTGIITNSDFAGSQAIILSQADSTLQIDSGFLLTESLIKMTQNDLINGTSNSLELSLIAGLSMGFDDGTNSITCNVTPTGIDTDTNITITDPTKGYILTSPDTNLWKLVVDNTGTLSTVPA